MKAVIGLASLTLVTSIAPAEVIIGYPGGRELSFSYDDNVILDSDDRVVHYRTAVRRLALSARNGIFRCGDRCCRATDGTIFVVDDPHSLARLLIIMDRTIYEREQTMLRNGRAILHLQQLRFGAGVFRRELEKAGWTVGQNLLIDFHWGTGEADWVRSAAVQMLRQAPSVMLANGDAAARAAQRLTQTVPIIFIAGSDPVGDGLVQSLAHPGGNLTGFGVTEPSEGTKLLGMLKQVAPRVTRVGALMNPDNATHKRIVSLLAAAASSFAVEVVAAPAREPAEIEAAIAKWGPEADYGLIVPADPSTNSQRKLIIELAARYRLPTIFSLRAATADGGLMSYGVDIPELFRQAAIYADRILKGEKPGDLPVQLPTKFELVINLKTAKSLSLDVPPSLLATADEVIE